MDHRLGDRVFVWGGLTLLRWTSENHLGDVPTIPMVDREGKDHEVSFAYAHAQARPAGRIPVWPRH
ncbi:MAG: hypothetical protein NZ554_11730 [Bryobacteraceae bacterium]|nr:hypothetical protein [Bryobacteraceae bacterium]